MLTITTENFNETVLNSQKPVLIDFWAVWCGPCQMQSPVLEELEDETDSFLIGKVNIDEQMELAQKYGVTAIPTLIVIKDGECVSNTVGFQTKDDILEMMKNFA